MGNKPWIPLTLALIDEGRFLDKSQADFEELQAKLINFCEEHGDLAKGAKAELKLCITLTVDDVQNGLFGIKAQPTMKWPARPPSLTVGMSNQTQTGEPSLFVRDLGSDDVTPRQGKMFTSDGKKISETVLPTGERVDRKTGEVKEAAGG